MRQLAVSVSIAWGVACALLGAPREARAADQVAECIAANERAVQLRKEGKLLDARREFPACADIRCPLIIQEACAARIAEMNASIPTIVFDIKDTAGRPVTGAMVSIDGKPAIAVGMTALPMDPGPHTFRFALGSHGSAEKRVSLLEGDKEKRVLVVVAADDARLARLVVSSEEGATVVVDSEAAQHETFDGQLPAGIHDLRVSAPGKLTYSAQINLREGETRSLSVSLEDAGPRAPLWPWIAGGVALAAGAIVGGYFLFRPQDTTGSVPPGRLAQLQLRPWSR